MVVTDVGEYVTAIMLTYTVMQLQMSGDVDKLLSFL